MSGNSSVGNRSVYEAGDQRNAPFSELQERARYAEGTAGSHKNLDSKDGRSIANKLASQENKPNSSHHHNYEQDPENELSKQDPTKPVSCISLCCSCTYGRGMNLCGDTDTNVVCGTG